jgi:hypothetical protein
MPIREVLTIGYEGTARVDGREQNASVCGQGVDIEVSDATQSALKCGIQ